MIGTYCIFYSCDAPVPAWLWVFVLLICLFALGVAAYVIKWAIDVFRGGQM